MTLPPLKNTDKVARHRLIADIDRKFNAEECVKEGGIAVDINGRIHRIICTDRKHQDGLTVVTLSHLSQNILREDVMGFTQCGNSHSCRETFLHHPSYFDKQGIPIILSEPPEKDGYDIVVRGFEYCGDKPIKYAYTRSEYNCWVDGDCKPRGHEGRFYIEYIKKMPRSFNEEVIRFCKDNGHSPKKIYLGDLQYKHLLKTIPPAYQIMMGSDNNRESYNGIKIIRVREEDHAQAV